MPTIKISNLSHETLRALRVRAASKGISMEAEARIILDEALRPADRLELGSALVELFRPLGGVDLDITREPARRDCVLSYDLA